MTETLKEDIIGSIIDKINEVEADKFEPKFLVLNRKTYIYLIAYLRERDIKIDDGLPNTFLDIPIVLLDSPIDAKVLTDAKTEFQYRS
jgi:hypothetical protein